MSSHCLSSYVLNNTPTATSSSHAMLSSAYPSHPTMASSSGEGKSTSVGGAETTTKTRAEGTKSGSLGKGEMMPELRESVERILAEGSRLGEEDNVPAALYRSLDDLKKECNAVPAPAVMYQNVKEFKKAMEAHAETVSEMIRTVEAIGELQIELKAHYEELTSREECSGDSEGKVASATSRVTKEKAKLKEVVDECGEEWKMYLALVEEREKLEKSTGGEREALETTVGLLQRQVEDQETHLTTLRRKRAAVEGDKRDLQNAISQSKKAWNDLYKRVESHVASMALSEDRKERVEGACKEMDIKNRESDCQRILEKEYQDGMKNLKEMRIEKQKEVKVAQEHSDSVNSILQGKSILVLAFAT